MPSITKARLASLEAAEHHVFRLEAHVEVLTGQLSDAEAALVALRTENDALRAQLHASEQLAVNVNVIRDRGALMQRLRELVHQGVPCGMRGDIIRHTLTGAVLAQVTR